jgi:hypothetical protein
MDRKNRTGIELRTAINPSLHPGEVTLALPQTILELAQAVGREDCVVEGRLDPAQTEEILSSVIVDSDLAFSGLTAIENRRTI